jgi:hypothetical protein
MIKAQTFLYEYFGSFSDRIPYRNASPCPETAMGPLRCALQISDSMHLGSVASSVIIHKSVSFCRRYLCYKGTCKCLLVLTVTRHEYVWTSRVIAPRIHNVGVIWR